MWGSGSGEEKPAGSLRLILVLQNYRAAFIFINLRPAIILLRGK